ncbi:hypothetical protein BLNAU_24041 [Blattamonas nauphoetae]|uniref:Uncharacterized protein n=1 Tax=Blattamonas nauphoetae TaxID=2049346 RepID=A0ABQ9WSN9_9EUKA|nr:hypothetical protein BLNAU_24041 [Blattamonas nauphoetae]
MLVDEPPVHTNIDEEKAKQTICGDRILLRSAMLNSLLTLVTESDWALSTILDVEYIKPLEQYCEQTQPGDVQITLPKLLFLIEIALTALSTECKSDFATRSFLRKLEVSYPSTDSSSELVLFRTAVYNTGRACFRNQTTLHGILTFGWNCLCSQPHFPKNHCFSPETLN